MTVIEADGVETDPVVVDQLQIYAGQRYSVVVEANQTAGNYCMWLSLISKYHIHVKIRDPC